MRITQPASQAAFPSFVLCNLNTVSSGVYVRFYFCRERGGRGKRESCVTLISPPADVGVTVYRDRSIPDL